MARQLLEAIELNRLLGVSHLMAYVHSMNSTVRHVLQHYERSGFATRVEMLSNSTQSSRSRHEHQQQHPLDALSLQELALNHCLLRSLARYRYAIHTDIDDFLMPGAHIGSLSRFVRQLVPSVRASAFMFRHAQLLPPADPFFKSAEFRAGRVRTEECDTALQLPTITTSTPTPQQERSHKSRTLAASEVR